MQVFTIPDLNVAPPQVNITTFANDNYSVLSIYNSIEFQNYINTGYQGNFRKPNIFTPIGEVPNWQRDFASDFTSFISVTIVNACNRAETTVSLSNISEELIQGRKVIYLSDDKITLNTGTYYFKLDNDVNTPYYSELFEIRSLDKGEIGDIIPAEYDVAFNYDFTS